jgi:hypothetical protein
MVKTMPASQIDLYSLEENFGLKRAYEPTFFPGMARKFTRIDGIGKTRISAGKSRLFASF